MEDKKYTDFIDKHRLFTRIITTVVIFVFIYSFMTPLSIEYAELSTYAIVIVLLIITFGLNALDKLAEILKAIKGK